MKKLLFVFLIVFLTISIFVFAQAQAETLSFRRDSLLISVGRYVTVYAYISPPDDLYQNVTFSVSDESIATVTPDGKVQALQAGTCELTATSKADASVSVTIPLQVIVPVSSVELTADTKSIVIGETLQISAAFVPESATLQSVVWSSSNDSAATVTQDGLVTGLTRGQAYIIAKTTDGKTTASMLITVRQPPESVTASPETVTVTEGKSRQMKATVLPADTNDKTVLWSSSNEAIATVSAYGLVTGVERGETIITATCRDDETVSCDIPVAVLKLATSVSLDQESYELEAGESRQLTCTVFPANTSNQAVAYQVSNEKIATVDENGMVTALKGGTTTVTVTTADGSRKTATATITVPIHVTGVSYSRTDIRVGENHYGHFTVNIEPSDATNTAMTWSIADEAVATVSGNTNTFMITGNGSWGRTAVTGTTEDGGYAITLNVNIGSLYRAVSVYSLSIRDGRPYITLKNNSGMVISQVSYYMRGLDSNRHPINMSTAGDLLTLYGSYNYTLYPGEYTQHGIFTFYSPSDYPDLTYLEIVITGWETATGYYNSQGELLYSYAIPAEYHKEIVYPSDTDPALF